MCNSQSSLDPWVVPFEGLQQLLISTAKGSYVLAVMLTDLDISRSAVRNFWMCFGWVASITGA